jgi:3-oxoacyl-[acyl-carrier protein] reductase
MKLRDTVVIITGGYGGIGSAISRSFTDEGASVIVFERDEEMVGKTGGVRVDVSDYASVGRGVARTLRKFGRIDCVVNCAGIQAPIGLFAENDMVAWEKNIGINLLGTVHMCRAVLPSMIKRRSGVIINFSGGGATSSRPNFSAYATAKAGIVKFTEVLADELKPYRIRINAIAPGAVNTKMLDEILKIGRKAGNVELAAAKKRALEGGISAELAAELAVFLASSDSANLSGRLVSAVWDDWKHWSKKDIKKIMAGESLTLRRVK